jgi:3-deoxy-D-manno-octulosonic-acid transferase
MQTLVDLCYLAALAAASPYCAYKLLTRKKIRAGMKQKLGFPPARDGAPCAWFHCVSVGEVGLARELIRRFCERFPECPAAVSTTTDTGRAAAEKHFPDLHVFYYPFDLSPAVRRTLRRIRPRCIVLMELELWPNLIMTALEKKVPVVIVNGRITQATFRRLRRLRFIVAPLLKSLSAIAVQDDDYAQRLIELGADADTVTVTGNMKYDTVKAEIDPGHPAYAAIRGATAGQMIVGGCTWPGEDEALLKIYAGLKQANPALGLTLAPRHATRLPAVQKLIEAAGFSCSKLSALKQQARGDDNNIDSKRAVILVDTFGELDAVYAAADLAFVGKSLTEHGGQNMLEPAALGKPVIFGPNTENFSEATQLLLSADAAVRVENEAGLREQIIKFLHNPGRFGQIGISAKEAVEKRKGATEKNLELLERVIADGA